MFSFVFRTFSYRATANRGSIYQTNPDIKPLFTNESFEIKPVKSNRHSRRCAVLALKQGMTAMWDKWGIRHALTVLQVDRCQVVQIKPDDKYYYIQLGVGERKLDKITKPLIGHYIKADVPPKKKLMECRITPENVLPVGYQLTAQHFIVGQTVDVKAITKGKGFQGGIKKWHFNRQTTSHGNSVTTRTIGSTGQRQDPGRTFPGKKMPGQLGNSYTTIQRLQVYKIDAIRNLIYIKGAVPGGWGTVVRICDSVKEINKQYRKIPHPTYLNDQTRPDVEVVAAPDKDTFEMSYLHDNALPTITEDDPIE